MSIDVLFTDPEGNPSAFIEGLQSG